MFETIYPEEEQRFLQIGNMLKDVRGVLFGR